MSMSPVINKCCYREAKTRNVAGMDGLEHALEHHGVQQREGHQGATQQPLEARHPHVQQVNILKYTKTRCWKSVYSSASEAFDSTYPTNVVVTSEGTCTYIPPGKMTIASSQWSSFPCCRHLHVELSNGYHVVPVWWSGLRDEIWQLDLQWLQGASCQMKIFLCPSFLHSSHFTIVLSWTCSSPVKKGILLHLFLMENGHF